MGALASLADDAVAIGTLRLAGGADPGRVRAQLAAVPTPSVQPWVFVRRLTVRATPARLGAAVREALEAVARDASGERVVFPDFRALAQALGADAARGQIAARWWWRALGLPAAPGAAIAALVQAEPLRIWEALIAWREAALLPIVWPLLTEAEAALVVAEVARVTRFVPPPPPPEQPRPLPPGKPPPPSPAPHAPPAATATGATGTTAAAARAAAFWAGALPPHRPELRDAAVFLSLLRWHPSAFAQAAAVGAAAGALRAALQPQRAPHPSPSSPPLAAPEPNTTPPAGARTVSHAAGTQPERPHDPAIEESVPSVEQEGAQAEPIRTLFGGTLFLINALERLGIRRRLAEWPAPEIPSGFVLLHDLALRAGLPEDDPLAMFLVKRIVNERLTPPHFLDCLDGELRALYPCEAEDGPGLFFLRQPAILFALPMHLDLHFAATVIDLRIRRAGLDRDPGWVPWLGRIVRFHYPAIPTRWARPR